MADSFSEHFKTMHGTFRNPAKTDALRRRSPATSSYSAAEIFLTDNGCKIPFSLIDAERAASSVSSKVLRGCALFGLILIIGISKTLLSFLSIKFNRIASMFVSIRGLSLCYYNNIDTVRLLSLCEQLF